VNSSATTDAADTAAGGGGGGGGGTLSALADAHLDAFFAHQLEATAARLNSPAFMRQLADAQFASGGGGKQKAHALVQRETDAVWEDLKPELRLLYEDFDADGNHALDRAECAELLRVYLPRAKKIQTAVAVGQVRNLLPTMIQACVASLGDAQTSLRPEDVEGIVLHMFEDEYIPIVERAYEEMFDKLAADGGGGEGHSRTPSSAGGRGAVADEMFRAMDTNGDGQLDADEFISGFAAAMRQVTNDPVRTRKIGDKIEPAMKHLMQAMMKQLHETDQQRREEERRKGGCCVLQ
jgi:hypothetical protein